MARPLLRTDLPRFYAIADAEALSGQPLSRAVAEMVASGVRWIQIRDKLQQVPRFSAPSGMERSAVDRSDSDRPGRVPARQTNLRANLRESSDRYPRNQNDGGASLHRELERLCREEFEWVPQGLWINDRADLAKIHAAAGIHVGQNDLPPEAIRRVVGNDCWIGLSTHSIAQLELADRHAEVDLIAIGPVFATRTKTDAEPVVGLELVEQARRRTEKPLVAIGGIDAGNAAQVLSAGADSVAVVSAACRQPIGDSCRRLLDATEGI